ncbi:MAG: leucine-rich repeat domain-containing protein [Bacteroidaceae bacterium]|nr:leucine-rich repeat domain-containing protein [Bacteroidaceae bacterium]
MDVTGSNIQDMKGIEYFTALKWLSCSNNQLTTLDVSNNTALEKLYCEDNQLTALDVSNNTALTLLGCGNNQLTALDVSKNTEMTSLYCYQNQIKGAAMDALVGGLPTVTDRNLYIIYTENEQNEMTVAQVAAAKAKGWTPCYTTGETYFWGDLIWKEYPGKEEFPDGILSMDNGKLTMDNYYDLNGRRFNNGQLKMDNGQLKPGIYIVNGKKVMVK